VRARRLTLSQYLRFRLGSRGGRIAWFNFFIKPFGASSFAQFWLLWIPSTATTSITTRTGRCREWCHALSAWPVAARAAINVAYLAVCVGAMLLLIRWL
jgi:hypothetical protein